MALTDAIDDVLSGKSQRQNLTDEDRAVLSRFQELSDQLERSRSRERELTALREISLDLTSRRDAEEVLRAIVRRARLIAGSDLGYLSIYDVALEKYRVRATEGVVSPRFEAMTMTPGHGVLAHVEQERKPFFSSDYMHDKRIAHSVEIDAAMHEEGLVSLLGVPLLLGDDLLGAFFIGDRHSRAYTAHEVGMLTAFAEQATLALDNARLLSDAREANRRLEAQTLEVQTAAHAHEEMTELVAKGGTVHELVALLANLVDANVLILDSELRLICASTAQDAQSLMPPIAELKHALDRSRRVGRSVSLEANHVFWRVTALMGVPDLLGALLVAVDRPLSGSAVRTIERGAIVTGIVMMSEERHLQRTYAEVSDFLSALFKSPQSQADQIAREARRLGLSANGSRLFMLESPRHRTGTMLKMLKSEAALGGSLVGEFEGKICILSANTSPEQFAKGLMDLLNVSGIGDCNVVYSRIINKFDEFPEQYRSVSRTARVMRLLEQSGEISEDAQLGIFAMILEGQNRDDIERFLDRVIGPLIKKDRASSSDLCGTLLSYVENGFNARAASLQLRIHVNTLRQRLESIERLIGTWEVGARSFEIHAALRVKELQRKIDYSKA